MAAVSFASYLIFSEREAVPALIRLKITPSWMYWADITQSFWSVAGILLVIAIGDYIYNFFSLEKKMKMTKQEVKDEFKKRELDPLIKSRLRKMQRDLANRKTIESTSKATVLITNPTHYSIAVYYKLGSHAPSVIAKGVDELALKMREVAKANDIPIVENKPLARTLYSIVEVDQVIPSSLYKAVSEVIRYVFKVKGIQIPKR